MRKCLHTLAVCGGQHSKTTTKYMRYTCTNNNIHFGFSGIAQSFERSIIKPERAYRSSDPRSIDPLIYGLEGRHQQSIFTNNSSSINTLYHTESPLQFLIEPCLVRAT
jgi:hypothetical protein